MTASQGHLSKAMRLRSGPVAAHADVNVYTAGTTTLATLYRNATGTPAVANPVRLNLNGQLDCYLAPGTYDLVPVDASIPPELGVPVFNDTGDLNTAVTGAGAAATVGAVGALTSTAVVTAQVTGDAAQRLSVSADGKHLFGGGTLAGDTTLYRAAADVLATDDDLAIKTAGKGLMIKEGSNAKMGTLTLNGATEVTVSTTAVTATSRIFLTVQAPAGTPAGIAYVSSRSAGVSFGVKGIATDTSTVAWMIIEPSA